MNMLAKIYPVALIINIVIFAFSLLPEMYVTWYLFVPAIALCAFAIAATWNGILGSRRLSIVVFVMALLGIQPILDTVFFLVAIVCSVVSLVTFKKSN